MARDRATGPIDHGFTWRGILVALAGLPNTVVQLLAGAHKEPQLVAEARVYIELQHGKYSFYLTPGHDGVAQVKRTTARTSRAVKYDNVVGSVLSSASKEDAAESVKAAQEMKRQAREREEEEIYGRTLKALERLAVPLFYRGDPTHYGNVSFVKDTHQWGTYECRVDVASGRVALELEWDLSLTLLQEDPGYGDAPIRVALEEVIRTMLRCQLAYAEKFAEASGGVVMAHTVRNPKPEEWTTVYDEDGRPQQVRIRSPREEARRRDGWDRWAQRQDR